MECGCCGLPFDRPGLWSPYFCEPCDGQRVRRIGPQLRAIRDRQPPPTHLDCDHRTVLTRAEVVGA